MTETSLYAVLVTALTMVVGFVAAYLLGTRQATDRRQHRAGRADGAGAAALLSPSQVELLTTMQRGLVVVDRRGIVAWSSPQARSLGLVRADELLYPQLRAMVTEALGGTGTITDGDTSTDLVLPRGPLGEGRLDVSVRLSRLSPQLVVLDVEDRSDARRVDEVRRDFVVNVSHELKTPVGAISLLAETMGDAADDPEVVRRFAGRMRQESARLASLVTDIIELSRVQYDDGLGTASVVELDAVVREAVEHVRWRADQVDIVVVLGPRTGARVHGDPELLTTAVRNLLVNAISYSPAGTRVSAAVRRHEGLVEVLVTDRGTGIPVAEQGRIFERFYRSDPARSRQTGGTGLGLAIVKHVAENHGGDVAVWSRPGQGSTFTVRLPEAQPPVTEPPGTTADSTTDSTEGAP